MSSHSARTFVFHFKFASSAQLHRIALVVIVADIFSLFLLIFDGSIVPKILCKWGTNCSIAYVLLIEVKFSFELLSFIVKLLFIFYIYILYINMCLLYNLLCATNTL